MFIDEAKIWVKAGNGGHGCMSFRREKFVPKGGPDGGNGGTGGSVIFLACGDVDTLLDFSGRPQWKAKNGLPGEGANRTGADGADLVLKVPAGTQIWDDELNLMIKDLYAPGMSVRICKGGKGGLGNKAFATSRNQTPRKWTRGKDGEERSLRLELKLIADIGLVGLPNAGKSTLVSMSSAARPKIANYPFTTLEPVLGIVELGDYRRFVMADIPGLIEGAHEGAGLGIDFLKHIERTRILVHILDVCPMDGSDAAENFRKINNELACYSEKMMEKPMIVAVNKIDLLSDDEEIEKLKAELGIDEIFAISAATGEGVGELNEKLWQVVREIKANEEVDEEQYSSETSFVEGGFGEIEHTEDFDANIECEDEDLDQ